MTTISIAAEDLEALLKAAMLPLADIAGVVDANQALLRLIARKVGVTADEIRAESERMREHG